MTNKGLIGNWALASKAVSVKADWTVTPFCGDFMYIFFIEVGFINADFRRLEFGVSKSDEWHRNCANVFVKSLIFFGEKF